jgi:hypothetical protein
VEQQTKKPAKMKKHSLRLFLLLAIAAIGLTSCGGKSRVFDSKEGVSDLAGELDKQFGKDASYTSLIMSYDKNIGTSVSVTGTKDPASKKMTEKRKLKGVWNDVSEITLEIEGDANASEFMFKLKDIDNLNKVPGLVKASIDRIKKEKNFDVVATSVNISAPDRIRSDKDRLRYLINLEPASGGTNFTAIYDHQGNFRDLLY